MEYCEINYEIGRMWAHAPSVYYMYAVDDDYGDGTIKSEYIIGWIPTMFLTGLPTKTMTLLWSGASSEATI